MIIGANDETDFEVLKRVDELYKKVNLQTSYFSPFTPIEGTDLEGHEACSNRRTAQLYHANALVNDYHFKMDEMVFDENDLLYLNEDPKILAAKEMDIFRNQFCTVYRTYKSSWNRSEICKKNHEHTKENAV